MIRKKWSVLCVVLFLAATLNGCAAPAVQEGLEEAESRQPSSEQPQRSEDLSSEEPQYTEEPPVSHEAQQTLAEVMEAIQEDADYEMDQEGYRDWTWMDVPGEPDPVQVSKPVLEGLTFQERIVKCAAWSLEYAGHEPMYQLALLDIVGDEMPELCVQYHLSNGWVYDITGDRVEPLVEIYFRGPGYDRELGWQFFRTEYPDGKEGYIIETAGGAHYRSTYYLWKQENGRLLGEIECLLDYGYWEDKRFSYRIYRDDVEWDGEAGERLDEAYWEFEKETEEEFLAGETGTLFYELYTLPRLEPVPVIYTYDGFWFGGDDMMTEMEEYAAILLEVYMAEHGIEAD